MKKIMVSMIFATMVISGNIFTAQAKEENKVRCSFLKTVFVAGALFVGGVALVPRAEPEQPIDLRLYGLFQGCRHRCLIAGSGPHCMRNCLADELTKLKQD